MSGCFGENSVIPEKDDVRKILVFKFGGIGDYVCFLPFLRGLRDAYPDAEISMVASRKGKEIIEHAGVVDKCIYAGQFSSAGYASVLSFPSCMDILKIKRMLDPPYDIYIDAVNKFSRFGAIKSRILRALARPVLSVGLSCEGRGDFHDLPVPEVRDDHKHNIERYNDMLRALGEEPVFRMPKITPLPESVEKAEAFFRDSPRPITGLHPGANPKFFKQRAWPLERFSNLAGLVVDEIGGSVYATGTAHERGLLEILKSGSRVGVGIVPPVQDVIEFCAYLSEIDFYIANDTGAMHLAVAMGVPTVGIFGYADYESYGTYPDDIPFRAVIREKTAQKTPSRRGDDPRMLRDISVEEVMNALRELKNSVSSVAREN